MLPGVVVKAYNGYYYVRSDDEKTMVSCSLRGRFKKERFSLLVGDEVRYSLLGSEKGVIEEILPRRTMLSRPMVANVDQVILNFAAANPDINPVLVDRFLIIAELSELEIILCINKVDLADQAALAVLIERYSSIGYPVLSLSAKNGIGIEDLRARLQDRITVFAGPSGTGKSTLLNAIEPGLSLATGQVSEKIGRGRHTTRFAELMPLAQGGYVVDTPGFSLTEFVDIDERGLMYCFRDLVPWIPQCRFNSCIHYKEPQCAVKEAVREGKIHPERYESYLAVLTELKENKKGFRL
ncbi:MAG TPA: ribosome small subunit-dependent GTPase A [Patescibacteria group bacterium]|nr:ribosome small subunit-dependent GTPase A [Patescibacteria group bacterium]